MGRKRAQSEASSEIFCFDCEETDIDGIVEGFVPAGEVISSFSFDDMDKNLNCDEKLVDNRRLQKQPYGRTPAVDGEKFEVIRTFLFRRSTVRMLNKLKAENEDENVYLSSIVDEAVRFYYDFVFANKTFEVHR
jgi:hypothetical protein